MKDIITGLALLFATTTILNAQTTTDAKVEALLKKMTLEEKIGQLNHLKGEYSTDNYKQNVELFSEIKAGHIGALTAWAELPKLTAWQKAAVDSSRLGIPLLYSADIIHGYRTIFPINLGQAASFDLAAIENSERIAAKEATSGGITWNFAPMVDITRDARWGRCMEGSGEDTYYGSKVAEARVRGFQGNDLSDENTLIATVKHFAAYGAAETGKEYNRVDMSERVLRETYLPPFKAAVDANVASIMNAFNVVDGIPASANKFLLTDVLINEWGFRGVTVSDANSFHELIPHGTAANRKEAAEKCIKAGSHTDLWSMIYMQNLEQLVNEGTVNVALVDEAVRRILKFKFELGLMDNPYKYLNQARMDSTIMHPNHLKAAEDLANKSIVLLKNEKQLLPIDTKKVKTIALIGPLADSRENMDMIGEWTGWGKADDVVTIRQGMEARFGKKGKILFAKGGEAWGKCTDELIAEAVKVAQKADLVVLAIGEHGSQSGEAHSRADISLPGNQEDLVKAISKEGKPTVGLIFNGRPLVLTEVEPMLDAILLCWQPGITAGNAVANVLSGDFNPCAKLPITMPYHAGQVPIYYNHLNSGRPKDTTNIGLRWVNGYMDIPNEPLYEFGFGLSYTTFDYSPITLSKSSFSRGDSIIASLKVINSGAYDGAEVVQLYIHDIAASVSRPIKELKNFQRIELKKGESKMVSFKISEDDLKYWNSQMKFEADAGAFQLMIGSSSDIYKQTNFELKN